MKTNARKFILFFLSLACFYTTHAQIQWNVNAGGGVSTMETLFDQSPFKHEAGPIFRVGTSISSLFGKKSIAGWEAGINIMHEQYDWISRSTEERRGTIEDWYVQMPVSLTLNLFENVGFHLGARINRRLSNLDTYAPDVRKWIPAAHLGIYAQITPRVRLDATAYIDIQTRNKKPAPGYSYDKTRGMGGSLNIRYTIK